MFKEYKSDSSKDIIHIKYNVKNHKGALFIKQYDNYLENIKLINSMITYLRANNIKWIVLNCKSNNLKIPQNTMWYKHKSNNSIHCHIEDFDKFYMNNMDKIIKYSDIYVPDVEIVKGWTVIIDKKKIRKEKMKHIKEKMDEIVNHWTLLDETL